MANTPGYSNFRRFRELEAEGASSYIPNPTTFTGSDLAIWFNNHPVANAESLTYSISIEAVANYSMGDRNPHSVSKGKRVIVGALTLTEWDRHALISEIFKIKVGAPVGTINLSPPQAPVPKTQTWLTERSLLNQREVPAGQDAIFGRGSSVARGLTRGEYDNLNNQRVQQVRNQLRRSEILHSDQIPPFDITVIGENDEGKTSTAALLGVHVTGETTGRTMNDMSSTLALTFICLGCLPWRPLIDSD